MDWGTLPQKCPTLISFLSHLETEAISESGHGHSAAGDLVWPAWISSRLKEAGFAVKWRWDVTPEEPSLGASYALESSVGNLALEADLVFEPLEAIAEGSSPSEFVEQGVLLCWEGIDNLEVRFTFKFQGDRAILDGVDGNFAPFQTVTLLAGRQYDGRRLFEVMLSTLTAEKNTN